MTRGTCELILVLETESAVWAEKKSETKSKRNLFLERDRGAIIWLVSERKKNPYTN
jgi:hypothetical protein